MNAPFFTVQRRYALLLEVIIAMSITIGIMSLLLIFYSDINRLSYAQEKLEEKNFRKLYLQTRLAAALPKALPFNDPQGDYFFFTSTNTPNGNISLVFAFDNGVKLTPNLSNHALGRLYINEKSQACLAVCPSPARWNEFETPKLEVEVLIEHVRDLKFEFYTPPAKERKVILANNKLKFQDSPNLILDLHGGWRKEWQQEFGDLPAIVKVTFMLAEKQGEPEEISLFYPLPHSHLIPLYDK